MSMDIMVQRYIYRQKAFKNMKVYKFFIQMREHFVKMLNSYF